MNIALDIEKHEPAELNRLLDKFYAEVENKNGQDYEPDSLRVMIAALNRHLREQQYPLSIVKDREFLVETGLGRKSEITTTGRSRWAPNKARNLWKEEEEEVVRRASSEVPFQRP